MLREGLELGEVDRLEDGDADGLAEGLRLELGLELGFGASSIQTSSRKHGGDHFCACSDHDSASRPLKYTTLRLSGCEPTTVFSIVQSRMYLLTGAAKE